MNLCDVDGCVQIYVNVDGQTLQCHAHPNEEDADPSMTLTHAFVTVFGGLTGGVEEDED